MMNGLHQIFVGFLVVAVQTLAQATPTTNVKLTSAGGAPGSHPTAPYTVFSITALPGSTPHFLSWTASENNIYLGGSSTASCSLNGTLCSNASSAAFVNSGVMYVIGPGGQMAYIAADGHLGFTKAHSTIYPSGANLLPFQYEKAPDDIYGHLTTIIMGATGFMACPIWESPDVYAVYAAIKNATSVPSGNVSDCFPFDALTQDYNEKPVVEYY